MIMKPSDAYKAENYNITSTLSDSGRDDDPSTIYYCNHCNRMLYHKEQDKSTGKHVWTCISCNIEFYPSNQFVRKANRFEVPEGPNKEMLTAVPNDDPKAFSTQYVSKHYNNLSTLFRMLEGRGFKFKHYEEH
jgi:DNA-directed RNA polymerase subunit M/transcription elongation factor TFIIS